MTEDDNDLTLRRLRRLAVLEPDRSRCERVRLRCRAAMPKRQPQRTPASASRPFTARVFESGLMFGLSVGYLFAIIHDLLRLYGR